MAASLDVAAGVRVWRRASLSLVDQGISSGTNFLAAIAAARGLSTRGFGTYSLLIVTYLLASGFFRAVSAEAQLVRTADDVDLRVQARAVTGSAVAAGVPGALVILVIMGVVSGDLPAAIVLAAGLPFLLVVDSLRYLAFARAQPHAALVIDVVWLTSLVLLLAWIATSPDRTVWMYVGAWSMSGAIAGVTFLVVLRALPSVPEGVRWMHTHRDIGWRYAADFIASTGVTQFYLYALAVVAGLSQLGGLRAAQTLVAPMNVLYAGMYVSVVPEGRRLLALGARQAMQFFVRVSALFTIAAVALSGVLLVIPTSVGEALLGDSWSTARIVMVPVCLTAVINGAATGALAGLRSATRPALVLRSRMVSLPFLLVVPIVGAVLGGSEGAAWGIAVGSACAGVVYWHYYRGLAREVAPTGLPPVDPAPD